jgi:hypothetical protein
MPAPHCSPARGLLDTMPTARDTPLPHNALKMAELEFLI